MSPAAGQEADSVLVQDAAVRGCGPVDLRAPAPAPFVRRGLGVNVLRGEVQQVARLVLGLLAPPLGEVLQQVRHRGTLHPRVDVLPRLPRPGLRRGARRAVLVEVRPVPLGEVKQRELGRVVAAVREVHAADEADESPLLAVRDLGVRDDGLLVMGVDSLGHGALHHAHAAALRHAAHVGHAHRAVGEVILRLLIMSSDVRRAVTHQLPTLHVSQCLTPSCPPCRWRPPSSCRSR